MKLPGKIKIGACDYVIKEIVVDSDDDFVGRCHPNQQLIEIDKRLPAHKKIQTLFHEIIHAICFEQGSVKISDHNTDILATGIVTVLRENPKLKGLI